VPGWIKPGDEITVLEREDWNELPVINS